MSDNPTKTEAEGLRDLWNEALAENERLRASLVEADIYLAALNWWEIGSLAKVGEVIGDAIGWDKVTEINEQYRPRVTRGLGQEYATLFQRNTELVLENERLEQKRVELSMKLTDAQAEIRRLQHS